MKNRAFITLNLNTVSGGLQIPIIALILPLLCSIVNFYFASYFGGYTIMGVYLLSAVCFVAFEKKGKIAANSCGVSFVIFCLVYFVLALIGNATPSLHGIAFWSVINFYAFISIDASVTIQKRIMNLSIISLAITAVLSLPVLLKNPGASRVLASNNFEIYGLTYYKSKGLCGFGITYSFVFVIPLLFLLCKKVRSIGQKLIFGGLIIVLCMDVALSGYTAALLLLIGELLLFLFFLIHNKFLRILLILVGGVSVVIFRSLLPAFLNSMSALFINIRAVSSHLSELASLMTNGSLNDISRFRLIKESFEMFLSSPVWGGIVYGSRTGGHSTFFDILGGWGIIGFIPFVIYNISFFVMVRKRIRNALLDRVWKVVYCTFIILQVINPIIANYEVSFTVLCFVPCMLFWLDEKYYENC